MADAGEGAEAAGRAPRRAGARRAGRNQGALERLRAARAGQGARAEAFEFRREEAVYETVDEAEYARIVEVSPSALLPTPRIPPEPPPNPHRPPPPPGPRPPFPGG